MDIEVGQLEQPEFRAVLAEALEHLGRRDRDAHALRVVRVIQVHARVPERLQELELDRLGPCAGDRPEVVVGRDEVDCRAREAPVRQVGEGDEKRAEQLEQVLAYPRPVVIVRLDIQLYQSVEDTTVNASMHDAKSMCPSSIMRGGSSLMVWPDPDWRARGFNAQKS